MYTIDHFSNIITILQRSSNIAVTLQNIAAMLLLALCCMRRFNNFRAMVCHKCKTCAHEASLIYHS